MFLEKLAFAATEKCGLTPELPVLLGVSGGADSLAMMHGLQMLGFNVIVAHLDHDLRPESFHDADYVEQLVESYQLPYIRKRIDVHQAAEQAGQSLEEAARHVRYRFLFDQARAHGALAVAVGHHADDQVETVLMHFLRGAALSGLSGMAYRRVLPIWDREIPLVRPLLGIWRDEIEAFVLEAGLVPRVDLSNTDTTYFRNRIRHELIPSLETYNPKIRQVIWHMADVFQEEDQFLCDLAEDAYEDCFVSCETGWVALDRTKYLQLSKAMQRRVLRHTISKLRPDLRDVGFEAIEHGLNMIKMPPGSNEIDLAARLNVVILQDVIVVKTWAAQLPDYNAPLLLSEDHEALLKVGKPINLRHGWRIEAELLSTGSEDILELIDKTNAHEALLDIACLELPLTVRGRKMGERWQPLGMAEHTQKLKDYLINEKVPEHLRDIWPLVCSKGEVAWVVGRRPSEKFKITTETTNLLRLRLVQIKDQN